MADNFVDIKNIMSTCGIFETAVCPFEYVADRLIECRAKQRLPQEAKSIIIAAFPYKVQNAPPVNISRYAAVPDYHLVCGAMLKNAAQKLKERYPENCFEPFIDNSPIPEVAAGVFAGLGILGKNGLLIHRKYGSYVFLGEIVTDFFIEGKNDSEKCLDCGQCSRACPINLRKKECLSAVNQQKNGLTDLQKQQIKNSGVVWGCDICSEVCPLNKGAENTYIKEFTEGYRNEYQPSENSEGRAYNWRGEKVIKRNFDIIYKKQND